MRTDSRAEKETPGKEYNSGLRIHEFLVISISIYSHIIGTHKYRPPTLNWPCQTSYSLPHDIIIPFFTSSYTVAEFLVQNAVCLYDAYPPFHWPFEAIAYLSFLVYPFTKSHVTLRPPHPALTMFHCAVYVTGGARRLMMMTVLEWPGRERGKRREGRRGRGGCRGRVQDSGMIQ